MAGPGQFRHPPGIPSVFRVDRLPGRRSAGRQEQGRRAHETARSVRARRRTARRQGLDQR